MHQYHFLAIDIGASSGRAILGILKNQKIELKEIHRFDNQMLKEGGHYCWNVERLYKEILKGLTKCINDLQFHQGLFPAAKYCQELWLLLVRL